MYRLSQERISDAVAEAFRDYESPRLADDIVGKLSYLPLKRAEEEFKNFYYSSMLISGYKRNLGNISKIAKISGLGRRTVERHLSDYGKDLVARFNPEKEYYQPELMKGTLDPLNLTQSVLDLYKHKGGGALKDTVQSVLETTITSYEGVLPPIAYESLKTSVPSIADTLTEKIDVHPIYQLMGDISSSMIQENNFSFKDAMSTFRAEYVQAVIEQEGGIPEAAETLGVNERTVRRAISSKPDPEPVPEMAPAPEPEQPFDITSYMMGHKFVFDS